MTRRGSFAVALAAVLSAAAPAVGKPLAVVGRIVVEGGVINDAFALDDAGRTLAWIRDHRRRQRAHCTWGRPPAAAARWWS
jgi:type IV secretory pathway protease TraF